MDTIKNIVGQCCTAIRVKQFWLDKQLVAPCNVLFMQMDNGVWHRIFFDAGVLFWRENAPPDFLHEEAFTYREKDYLYKIIEPKETQELIGLIVTEVHLNQKIPLSELTFTFANQRQFTLQEVSDEQELIVANSA